MIKKCKKQAILGAGRIMKEVTIVETNETGMLKAEFQGPFFVEHTDVTIICEGYKYNATVRLVKDNVAILKRFDTAWAWELASKN